MQIVTSSAVLTPAESIVEEVVGPATEHGDNDDVVQVETLDKHPHEHDSARVLGYSHQQLTQHVLWHTHAHTITSLRHWVYMYTRTDDVSVE